MSFSLRKMLSNISYFKKPDDDPQDSDEITKKRRHTYVCTEKSSSISFDRVEPDSTSRQCATSSSLKLPDSVKIYAAKKGSLSDTDLLTVSMETPKKDRKKCKKLRLDIKKASKSMDAVNQSDSSNNVENTPKHVLLDCKSEDLFSERFHGFDFSRSFEISDAMCDELSFEEDNLDIESLSEHSDTDISIVSEKESIKMCRKVDHDEMNLEQQLVPSASPESFGDVEVEKNEEERMSLLLNYQMKLEKMECFLKKLLSEFQFHIEVSKVFLCKSIVTTLPGTDVSNIPKVLGQVTYIDNVRGISPTGSWNIIMEKEDGVMKSKLKKQLLSMRHTIDEFVHVYLQNQEKRKKMLSRQHKSITFDLHKEKRQPQRRRISNKKKYRHFDFPDYRDAFLTLFSCEDDFETSFANTPCSDDSEAKCICNCHSHSPISQTDSALTIKEEFISSQSISSSIGNFSLDSSTLTAYSESLDQIVSYNSFQDTSLYNTLLQKAAIERITFYVQVHSIQLKCELSDQEYESKIVILFDCPVCKSVENEENGLLKHILSQSHCEKIHFLYKTAYIKKCVSAGKEIMPSTVLNPMTMYRDDNKIVCFGDAMYACSLCFENLIVGESVLMAHCGEADHIERREKLSEILD
ncbi:uncharacterized protein LOC128682202 [Plodia interpunctella]|uniref:uncharacterized protein LOC128682202 n=1 Tax=Plodia interpunctella TaxID=58824 RepID=UPI002368BC6F|nr:uncharacterized protein LOC128682202 [Plodia interpunctella]